MNTAWNRWCQNLPSGIDRLLYDNHITPIIITDITEDITYIYKIRIPALPPLGGLQSMVKYPTFPIPLHEVNNLWFMGCREKQQLGMRLHTYGIFKFDVCYVYYS